LDEIQIKVLKVFLLFTVTSTYSFALRFLIFQTHAISYSFYSSVTVYTVKEKGGTPDRKPYPLTPMVKEIRTDTSCLRTLKIMPRNLNEIRLLVFDAISDREVFHILLYQEWLVLT
jgi:hypothetical protein